MPELPEVQTTVDGLNRSVRGFKIISIETSYGSSYYRGKEEIKNPQFFQIFKERVLGAKILEAERRGKNILIHLSNNETIIVHMKMTGHFVYDRPNYPFVRLDFTLDNGKHLVLSDMRRFAKVALEKTDKLSESLHLKKLGPEPLDLKFKIKEFEKIIKNKARGKIKQVLMNPEVIAGIGNIYSDEILWRANVHPLSLSGKIPMRNLKLAFTAMKQVLEKGIKLGGDSMSDYRNIEGERGDFQNHHRAYQKHRTKCAKKGCEGVIEKIKVGSRSAHFCPKHQELFK